MGWHRTAGQAILLMDKSHFELKNVEGPKTEVTILVVFMTHPDGQATS